MYFCENTESDYAGNNREYLKQGLNGIVTNMIKILNVFLEPQITYNNVEMTNADYFISY